MQAIPSKAVFDSILANHISVLAYFSHEECSVCKTLKPKLKAYFEDHFPHIKQVYVNIVDLPEMAAAYSVFTVPVVVVYFEGKESYRKARAFGVQEIAALVQRPYSLLFKS